MTGYEDVCLKNVNVQSNPESGSFSFSSFLQQMKGHRELKGTEETV